MKRITIFLTILSPVYHYGYQISTNTAGIIDFNETAVDVNSTISPPPNITVDRNLGDHNPYQGRAYHAPDTESLKTSPASFWNALLGFAFLFGFLAIVVFVSYLYVGVDVRRQELRQLDIDGEAAALHA